MARFLKTKVVMIYEFFDEVTEQTANITGDWFGAN